jgi:hypothetical protein
MVSSRQTGSNTSAQQYSRTSDSGTATDRNDNSRDRTLLLGSRWFISSLSLVFKTKGNEENLFMSELTSPFQFLEFRPKANRRRLKLRHTWSNCPRAWRPAVPGRHVAPRRITRESRVENMNDRLRNTSWRWKLLSYCCSGLWNSSTPKSDKAQLCLSIDITAIRQPAPRLRQNSISPAKDREFQGS